MNKLIKLFDSYGVYIAWTITLAATFGSLYFSEIMNLPPCILCWYQRICMYPQLVILTVGILIQDKKSYLYAFPLSIIGLAISAYHMLLYYNVITESLSPCVAGISCTTRFFEWFGFITIPSLSFMALLILNLIYIGLYLNSKRP